MQESLLIKNFIASSIFMLACFDHDKTISRGSLIKYIRPLEKLESSGLIEKDNGRPDGYRQRVLIYRIVFFS